MVKESYRLVNSTNHHTFTVAVLIPSVYCFTHVNFLGFFSPSAVHIPLAPSFVGVLSTTQSLCGVYETICEVVNFSLHISNKQQFLKKVDLELSTSLSSRNTCVRSGKRPRDRCWFSSHLSRNPVHWPCRKAPARSSSCSLNWSLL